MPLPSDGIHELYDNAKVWSHALELTTSTTSACELVFHYTPKQNFGTITTFSKEEIAIKFRLMKAHDTHSII